MVAWGGAYVPSTALVETWSPLAAAAARLGLAGMILLALQAARRRPWHPGIGLVPLGWLALTQTTLFYGAVFWGLAAAGTGLTAVLSNTDPLMVAALGAVFLGERLRSVQWTGLVVGLVGAALVATQGDVWPPAIGLAAWVVLGGALAWSIGTITAVRGMRGRAEPWALAGWQMIIGAAGLAIWAALAGDGAGPLGPREIALIVGLAALGSALPIAAFYSALTVAPASEISSFFFLVPVIGVATAWPLLGERPGPSLLVGMVAVAAGLWLVLGERRR